MTDPDDEVIAAARSGDRAALGVLWSAHQPPLLRFLRGMGCGSPQDVASAVWIDVARGLGRFAGGPTDFKRWLFTIARRRSLDELRRTTRESERLGALVPLDAWTEDAAEAYERAASLDRAIDRVRGLAPEVAEIVLLRVVADLDVAEVARLVGKSEGNVRVIMHRALARLAEESSVTNPVRPAMNTVP